MDEQTQRVKDDGSVTEVTHWGRAWAQERAAGLLEQAFETVRHANPFDPLGAPDIRARLPESERLLYVIAGQGYAMLALSFPRETEARS